MIYSVNYFTLLIAIHIDFYIDYLFIIRLILNYFGELLYQYQYEYKWNVYRKSWSSWTTGRAW